MTVACEAFGGNRGTLSWICRLWQYRSGLAAGTTVQKHVGGHGHALGDQASAKKSFSLALKPLPYMTMYVHGMRTARPAQGKQLHQSSPHQYMHLPGSAGYAIRKPMASTTCIATGHTHARHAPCKRGQPTTSATSLGCCVGQCDAWHAGRGLSALLGFPYPF